MLEKIIRAGMDVARLNMSHGSYSDHRGYIRAIRAASRKLDRPVGILLDLQGIKIRITAVAGEGIFLRKGREILLRSGQRTSTVETLYISYSTLGKDVKAGHRVLLDDGLIEGKRCQRRTLMKTLMENLLMAQETMIKREEMTLVA